MEIWFSRQHFHPIITNSGGLSLSVAYNFQLLSNFKVCSPFLRVSTGRLHGRNNLFSIPNLPCRNPIWPVSLLHLSPSPPLFSTVFVVVALFLHLQFCSYSFSDLVFSPRWIVVSQQIRTEKFPSSPSMHPHAHGMDHGG